MSRPKIIILCGIPGSGKTSYGNQYIEEHINTIHLSSDAIRKELYNDESIQGDPSEVFSLMQHRAVEALNQGQSVVYDCTNITRKDRSGIISVCPKFAKSEAHIVWQPIDVCIKRDAARERTVGKEVIDRMLRRFQAPYYDEDIHEIKIIIPDDLNNITYGASCYADMNIPHDNPNHTLNILEHCFKAQGYLYNNNECDSDLIMAALRHDIGKPYVKAFMDSKGNASEKAHYYGHQGVGAWMSYGLHDANEHIAWLISTHMDVFLNTKYYNNLPSFLKKEIDLLHEADLYAH